MINNVADMISDIYPLSYMQEGMLFQTLMGGRSDFYVEQMLVTLTGKLDAVAFKKSWQILTDRHSILRTIFDWQDGESPVQIVLKQFNIQYSEIDYTAQSEKQRNEVWSTYSNTDKTNSFLLDTVPPIRFSLAKYSDNEHKFLMTYHHLLLDGSSIRILLKDLASIYNSLLLNKSIDSEIGSSYKEYVDWLSTLDNVSARDFWMKSCLEINKQLETSRIPKIARTFSESVSTSSMQIDLDLQETIKFRNECKEMSVTPSNALQALWSEVLRTVENTNTSLFGVPTSVRLNTTLAGLCINTIPISITVTPGETLKSLVKKMQEVTAKCLEYNYYPLREIKKYFHYDSFDDPFTSLFTYTWLSPEDEIKLEGISWQLDKHDESTQYPLSMDAVLSSKELIIKITYHSDIYSQEQIIVLLDLFKKEVSRFSNPSSQVYIAKQTDSLANVGQIFVREKSENRLSNATTHLNEILLIWNEVFMTNCSQESNFFALGGDSISALRIISKCAKLGLKVSIQDIFEGPTPLLLAQRVKDITQPAELSGISQSISSDIEDLIHQEYESNVEKIVRVSPIQNGMLVSRQNALGLFHDQSSFTYKGEINASLFEKAWNHVVERNPTLRTVFYTHESSWYQVILRKNPIKVSFYDLTNISANEQVRRTQEYIEIDRSQSFVYEKGPLLRLSLFKTSGKSFVFFLSFHVICMDGWCFAFILKEALDTYESLRRGSSLKLEHRPSYEKYIAWVESQDREKAREYWKKYLNNVEEPLIPRLKRKDISTLFEIKTIEKTLPENILEKMATVATQHKITLNTCIQVSWAKVIRSYGTSDEVMFGATVAGRPADIEGYDKMVGLFFNDIPVRISINKNVSFWTIASQMQADFQESKKYEYIPASEIKELVGLGEQKDLFQTLLVFENYPKYEEHALKSDERGSFFNTAYWRRDMSDIDLTVYIEMKEHGIQIKMSYLEHLLDRKLVKQLLEKFSTEIITISEEI